MYMSWGKNLLSDKSTYTKFKKDGTIKIENKNNNFIDKN